MVLEMKIAKKPCCNDLNAAKVVGLVGAAGVFGLAGILLQPRHPLGGLIAGTVMGAAVGRGLSGLIERYARVRSYRKVSRLYNDYETESGM
jgi:predicted DNA repair protein MutK